MHCRARHIVICIHSMHMSIAATSIRVALKMANRISSCCLRFGECMPVTKQARTNFTEGALRRFSATYLCGGHALRLDNACHVLIFIHHLQPRAARIKQSITACEQQDNTLLLHSLVQQTDRLTPIQTDMQVQTYLSRQADKQM